MKIVKIPLEGGSPKYKGLAKSPSKIMSYFQEYFNFDNNKIEIEKVETDNYNLEESHKNIERFVEENNVEDSIFLGGDHSITLPIVRALKKKVKRTGLIIFDAHADAVDSQGNSHEDFVANLIDNQILANEDILIIGLRNLFSDEFEFLSSRTVKTIASSDFVTREIDEIADIITEFARKFEHIHISIDIDVIDGLIIKNVSYIEPAGLLPRELLYLIRRLLHVKVKKSFDIVEVNSEKEGFGEIMAARIIKLIIDFYSHKKFLF